MAVTPTGSIALVIATLALVVGLCACIAIGVTSGTSPTHRLLQYGTCAFTVNNDSPPIDTKPTTYRLYETTLHGGVVQQRLEIDPLDDDLDLGPNVSTANQIQVLVNAFDPPVNSLTSLGNWEYVFPLSYQNLNVSLAIHGACYAEDSCYLSGWGATDTQGSIAFFDSDSLGYIGFYLNTYNTSVIDWSDYKINLAQKWNLNLPSV